MSEIELDYEADRSIDHNALDIEWVEQANHYGRYAEQLAHAKLAADSAKENLDIVDTDIIAEIRKDPEKHGLDPKKVTETAMKGLAKLDKRHTEAFEKELKAKHDVDVLAGAVKAFDHKKAALENLVKLMAAQYFASPSEPRDLDEEVVRKMKQERRNKDIRKVSTRTRRSKGEMR